VAASAAAGTSVVQELVVPRTCRLAMVADGVDQPYDVDVAPVLGPLLFGGRPAGMFSRFFGDGTAGIVSVGHPQLRRLRRRNLIRNAPNHAPQPSEYLRTGRSVSDSRSPA
jgi:hypothetical protein